MAKLIADKFSMLRHKLKNYGKSGMIKAVGIFLITVIVCTVLSRFASSLLTPHIETAKATTRKIEHTVVATGTIEASKEVPVYLYPGVLVDEVMVKNGDKVGVNMPLIRYNQDALQSLYEEASLQMELYTARRETVLDTRELDVNISECQQEIKKLDSLLANNGIVYSDTSGWVTAVNATAGEYAAETAAFYKTDNSREFELFATVSENAMDYKGIPVYIYPEVLIDQVMVKSGSRIEAGTPLVRYNLEMLQTKRHDLAVQLELYAAQRNKDYDEMEIDAKIDECQNQMDEVEELLQKEGVVSANSIGQITAVNVRAGDYAPNTAAFYQADISQGYELVATVSGEKIRYIVEGESARIVTSTTEENAAIVSVVQNQENPAVYDVRCRLSEEGYSIGMTATIVFTHQSDSDGLTIPIEALRGDGAGNYVLVVGYKNGILGEEMTADKVSVTVEDSNDSYAAVKSSALSGDDLIIVSSDKPIENGDVVRLGDGGS